MCGMYRCVCMCMCIICVSLTWCGCICVRVYVRVCMCTYVCVHVYICVYIHAHNHTQNTSFPFKTIANTIYIYIYIYIYAHTHIHKVPYFHSRRSHTPVACWQISRSTQLHACIYSLSLSLSHTHTHTHKDLISIQDDHTLLLHVDKYREAHNCMHAYTHTHTHTHTHTQVPYFHSRRSHTPVACWQESRSTQSLGSSTSLSVWMLPCLCAPIHYN